MKFAWTRSVGSAVAACAAVRNIVGRSVTRVALAMAIVLGALSLFQASDAKATTFNWEFQGAFTYIAPGNDYVFVGTTLSGAGTLTANFVSGVEYLVTSIAGTVYVDGNLSDPQPVNSLLSVNTIHSNDNKLFFPASVSQPLVDFAGLGLNAGGAADPYFSTDFAIYYISTSSGTAGNTASDCGAVGYCIFTGGNAPGSLISLSSFAVSETPLPSTWLMLLSSIPVLGFFVFQGRKRHAAALAV